MNHGALVIKRGVVCINDLKLLYITRDHSDNLEKSSDYLFKELAKQTQCGVWHENGDLEDILNRIPNKPDFILLNDMKPDYCPFIRGISRVKIPVGIIMHDLQYKKHLRKKFIEDENIRYIFSIYRDPFLKWYPEFADRMIWFPHHVPTHIFKDYKLSKTINWLMMGSNIPRLYPLRNKMIQGLQEKEEFVYHAHPRYREIQDHEQTVFAGERYAQEINRAKIFLTCDSIYKFPVLKYFEVPACHTLLLAPSSKELNDLGFLEGETFIAIDESNFLEAADYYLQHEDERKQIARNGFDMVHQRHTTNHRVHELLEKIKIIIGEN